MRFKLVRSYWSVWGERMVRVVAGVVVRQGLVLVAQRAAAKRMGGLWEFPGGKVEGGEDDATALIRELAEELAIVVEVGECLGENIETEERGPFCLVAYKATIRSGEPVLSEHQQMLWLPPERLGELEWAPADIPFVEQLISGSVSCT